MRCETIQDHLGSYVLGEVSPRVCRRIERHLAQCSACRAELERLSVAVRTIYERAGGAANDAASNVANDAANDGAFVLSGKQAAAALVAAVIVVGVAVGLLSTRESGGREKERTREVAAMRVRQAADFSAPTGGLAAALDSKDLAVFESVGYMSGEGGGGLVDGWSSEEGGRYRGPGDSVPALGIETADAIGVFVMRQTGPGTPGPREVPGKGAGANRGAGAASGEDGKVRRVPLPPPTQGALRARDAEGQTVGEFPLEHTDVHAEIAGFLASTRVTQQFKNPFTEPIEAVYVFPLPTLAAIHDFVMEIGGRRIVGLIREREEAERIYAEARARGQTASLLTQERTNIFTQNVANIEPGGQVDVTITYFQTLEYRQGRYEYSFPMVVGPRYIPGPTSDPAAALGGPTSDPAAALGGQGAGGLGESRKVGGGGTRPDTDQVPDASRISPPVLREGERSGHDISLEVAIDVGVPLGKVESPTHEVTVETLGQGQARVRLAKRDAIPNRDFVLRYRIAGERLRTAVLAHRTDEQGGFLVMMLVPQLAPQDGDVTPREITFILDTSGSMSGTPLAMSKRVVRRTLESLRPADRFNIIQFAGGTGRLSERMLVNTRANVERGLAYLDSMKGGGGTEMLSGIRAYLESASDPGFVRIVCFLTDGFVGNEDKILSTIREKGQEARWFSLGVGSSVNRMLIEGIAKQGRGASMMVLPRDDDATEKAVSRFYGFIDSPVLVDIDLDWGALPVSDVYPPRPRDLFAAQPIVLVGRYDQAAQGVLTVRGRVGLREVSLPVNVTLPGHEERHEAMGALWARRKIAELSEGLLDDPNDADLVEQITNLALEFRLMSRFTSFVAVDESRVVSDGRPLRVLQPVELPEDVLREGALGQSTAAARIEAWGVTLALGADRRVRVAVVDPEGVAAGLHVGDEIESVDRTRIRSLRHLEALLLQAADEKVALRVKSASEDAAARELVLPRP